MKLQSNIAGNILSALKSNEIKNLTIQVKETIANGFTKERKRVFSAAQLWDIQRRRKNALSTRNYF